MKFHLLKNNEKIRPKPLISTIPFQNWLLPSWFVKQSDPLSPGYVIDCNRFTDLCHRNWTAFFNAKGEEILAVDEDGTISFPKIGVSIEIWVNSGKTLFRPGYFLKTQQKASSDFPCIRTKSVFENGFYENRIFQIDGTKNGTVGMEIEFHAIGEHAFSDFLLFFVIRPFDHNGLTAINRLDYKNQRLKVNNKELIQCETEPDIVFCTQAEAGDVTEYFKFEQNNEAISSSAGNCTGTLGYTIRPADRRIIRLVFKTGLNKLFSNQDVIFSKEWLFESEQKWVNRYHFQHRMIRTGSKVDYLYHTNMNFFNMFSNGLNEWFDVYGIFVLNRFALLNKSRAFLITAIKKIRWDGSMPSSKRLGPETLIYALTDYYRFSGDRKLIKDNWQLLKRIGFWLIQNKEPIINGSNPEYYPDLGWACAAFKGLSELSEISGYFEDYRFFRVHFQQLWADLLSFFSHRIKEDHQGFQKNFFVSNTLDWLCLSYPLGLYPRNERFIKEWLLRIIENSLNNGGVFSPFEFQGVDPGLTARLGSILLREGLRYEPVFKFLTEAASPTGCWPDRLHPVLKSGIGVTGHAPDVCCHFLLLFRNMMVMEEEEVLYLLPGIINSFIWHDPNIELRSLPTVFGEITLKCRSVGKTVQIDFSANFRNKPRLIRLLVNAGDRLLYSDSFIGKTGKWVELGSDFKIARLRRDLN
jgi:hypothetical protein